MPDEQKKRDVLEDVPEFPEAAYSDFDLNRLVCFTLSWLQDHRIPTTFENIVVAAFRMFPAKFALEGYASYPDAARTNRALLQLRPKYRNWARGNVQKGFILTESGIAEVAQVREALHGTAPRGRGPGRRQAQGLPRTMDLSQELQQLELSALFAKWQGNQLDTGTVLEFLDMLNAYAYTPPKALKERIDILESTARQLERDDLVDFLQAVRKTFAQQVRTS